MQIIALLEPGRSGKWRESKTDTDTTEKCGKEKGGGEGGVRSKGRIPASSHRPLCFYLWHKQPLCCVRLRQTFKTTLQGSLMPSVKLKEVSEK